MEHILRDHEVKQRQIGLSFKYDKMLCIFVYNTESDTKLM
jgi:hypothetical protein